MCYGMGFEREFPDTGTCADPGRCPLYASLPVRLEKELVCGPLDFYCPGCETRGRRCYLRFDRQDGFYCCDGCGEAYDRETLSGAYAAEAGRQTRAAEAAADAARSVESLIRRLSGAA